MFASREAMKLSTLLRDSANEISRVVWDGIEQAVVGCGSEIAFFRMLIQELKRGLDGLRIPGVTFASRVAEVHQRPIVEGAFGRCELGDLLLVVKYHLLDFSMEAKSIVYQVKMADRGSRRCSIDPIQLELLRDWPSFEFGRKRDGGRSTYTIQPRTAEFGSYMLEPRSAGQGYCFCHHRLHYPWHCCCPSYGVCPTALECDHRGPGKVDLDDNYPWLSDVASLVCQILFDRGEHHSNSSVARLVEALYRYVDLSPDPPGEFEGFWSEGPKDGFAVLEINVKQTGEEQGERAWDERE